MNYFIVYKYAYVLEKYDKQETEWKTLLLHTVKPILSGHQSVPVPLNTGSTVYHVTVLSLISV